jgi:hypothetical protein
MTTIKSFVERLAKIGIKVEFIGNFPGVYLDKVNNIKVKGTYAGNHGFTAFFLGIRPGEQEKITDVGIIFDKIREALNRSDST